MLSSDVLRSQNDVFVPVPTALLRGCRMCLNIRALGANVLNHDSEIGVFPKFISCLAFSSRLEESLVCPGEQDLGSSW